ncbi:hypothetical protein LTR56_023404 [Elasticomyces elasticus]|nr:hypothetical protein LTR56_023404 [Elasticomyces elasticus]KAK3622758.1 hypothetical protein LTR22_024673 [Elasticomyces elasticus]KAK4928241.1 hypothetical protein LTR49_004918 [Elasticomyces elasticus]
MQQGRVHTRLSLAYDEVQTVPRVCFAKPWQHAFSTSLPKLSSTASGGREQHSCSMSPSTQRVERGNSSMDVYALEGQSESGGLLQHSRYDDVLDEEPPAFRRHDDTDLGNVLNPYAVGDQEIVYQPLVIGGPSEVAHFDNEFARVEVVANAFYRADSFICASAVHAGFLQDLDGGCGVLKLTGEQPAFTSSIRFGIQSIGFDSYFPKSFGFEAGSKTACKDLRWVGLIGSAAHTVVLGLFTTDAAVFFWGSFTGLFFHVALISDPPTLNADSLPDIYALISIAVGRFLPAAFCAWVIYRYVALHSLHGLTAQVEKTLFWLGAAWVGALNNYTFDRLPIQRLTSHDIMAQPGALTTLVVIVVVIVSIAIGQAWAFRMEGRLFTYVQLYGVFAMGILFTLAIPGLELRIHHYILALLLLPGTSFQNRLSLIYQGLLVGLFINGVARWGFDSVLQTPGELIMDGQLGTVLPNVTVVAARPENITFSLGALPMYDTKTMLNYHGISALVNDVERFRGSTIDGGNITWTWVRHGLPDHDLELHADWPEYFRFGYVTGDQLGDYTKAGKWTHDGSWVDMKTGPSL